MKKMNYTFRFIQNTCDYSTFFCRLWWLRYLDLGRNIGGLVYETRRIVGFICECGVLVINFVTVMKPYSAPKSANCDYW